MSYLIKNKCFGPKGGGQEEKAFFERNKVLPGAAFERGCAESHTMGSVAFET